MDLNLESVFTDPDLGLGSVGGGRVSYDLGTESFFMTLL